MENEIGEEGRKEAFNELGGILVKILGMDRTRISRREIGGGSTSEPLLEGVRERLAFFEMWRTGSLLRES